MDYEKYSEILKCLAHPVRLRMVQGLMHHECNVNAMVEGLRIPQSTVSQHLSQLRNHGIIKPRKQGVKTCYQVVDEKVKKIIQVLEK